MSIIVASSIILGSIIISLPLRKIHKTLKNMDNNVKDLNGFFNRKLNNH